MEVDEFQNQVFKFQRIGSNGRSNSNGTSSIAHPNEEENRALLKRSSGGGSGGGSGGNGMDLLGVGGRLCGWPSSRIVRVSRASGGKDRHSKVLTSKGLRDRRVRLSVSTAIQFYDLQDRLGYDQPSKAVEWLLKAAASSISELPSLNPGFPDTPKSDEKRSSEITEPGFELDGDPNLQHHQNVKSACSSTSETSKGSGGLSLSRSESRVKARERARERAAEKEKEKENDSHHHQNVSSISLNSSFTELLTAGINNNINDSTNGSGNQNSGGGGGESDLGANKSRGQSQWLTPMDNYLFTPSSSRSGGQMSSGFPGHMNSLPQFTSAGDQHHQPELQQFSFVPVATTAGESYNLNFSMSSSAGFNRGTLQSNSSLSFLSPHLQRFNSIDGSMPFFIGSTTPSSNAAVENNHHQFPAGLQLCYGETPSSTGRHSDNNHKGKGKH